MIIFILSLSTLWFVGGIIGFFLDKEDKLSWKDLTQKNRIGVICLLSLGLGFFISGILLILGLDRESIGASDLLFGLLKGFGAFALIFLSPILAMFASTCMEDFSDWSPSEGGGGRESTRVDHYDSKGNYTGHSIEWK